MISAWEKAKVDLGIEIEFPFTVGKQILPLLVKFFGSKFGTVCVSIHEMDMDKLKIPEGYYLSQLNPKIYERYEREIFIETLEDWGWFGPESQKPKWYTGKYYNSL